MREKKQKKSKKNDPKIGKNNWCRGNVVEETKKRKEKNRKKIAKQIEKKLRAMLMHICTRYVRLEEEEGYYTYTYENDNELI